MKAKVIAELSTSADIIRVAKRIAKGNDIYKDILQYMFETLLKMPDEKIKHAVDNNYLKYLCVRIMNLSMNQPRHPFAIEHNHLAHDVDVLDYLDKCTDEPKEISSAVYTEDEIDSDVEDKLSSIKKYLEQEITQDNYFDLTIFKLWSEGMSYRKIAEQVGFHHMVVHNSINRSKAIIREQYG